MWFFHQISVQRFRAVLIGIFKTIKFSEDLLKTGFLQIQINHHKVYFIFNPDLILMITCSTISNKVLSYLSLESTPLDWSTELY